MNNGIKDLYEKIETLQESAKGRADLYRDEYMEEYGVTDYYLKLCEHSLYEKLQYWRGISDAYNSILGHLTILKELEGNPDIKYIGETCGLFATADDLGFICPVCGRKKLISREDGELRGIVHCRCNTGNQKTVFKEADGGCYEYTNEQGITIVL